MVRKEFNIEIPVSFIFEDSILYKYAESIDQILTRGFKSTPVCESFDLWRDREVVLDPTIDSKGAAPPTESQYTHPKKILITGAIA